MSASRSTTRWLDSILHDARYGVRGLRRTPLASGVMIASVALGSASRPPSSPLPTHAASAAPVSRRGPSRRALPNGDRALSCGNRHGGVELCALRPAAARRRGFEDAGFATWLDAMIRTPDLDVSIRVEAITRSLLTTFAIRPQMGRLFGADEDDAAGPSTVALISDHLWTTTYGGSPAIVGSAIQVNGVPVTVVGIMPKGFTGFTVGADMWLPVRMTARIDPSPRWTARFNALNGTVIARARPGTSIDALRRQIAIAMPLINETVTDQSPRGREARGAGVTSLREARRHPLVKPMLSLMGVGVVSLLLIVCANIASILLARGHARRGELGVRVALGASQWRVGRQVLTESTVLGALGLPAGILLGVMSASAIAALRPTLPQNWVLLRGTDLLAGASLSPNARVLTFAAVVAGLATLLFGSGPALVASA